VLWRCNSAVAMRSGCHGGDSEGRSPAEAVECQSDDRQAITSCEVDAAGLLQLLKDA
jgi:hypothetical protein